MKKEVIGQYMVWGGYAATVLAAVLAGKHPWIIGSIVVAGALIFVGRQLEKTDAAH